MLMTTTFFTSRFFPVHGERLHVSPTMKCILAPLQSPRKSDYVFWQVGKADKNDGSCSQASPINSSVPSNFFFFFVYVVGKCDETKVLATFLVLLFVRNSDRCDFLH